MGERQRVFNGEGFKEKYATCRACPVGTYSDVIGSSKCRRCPSYHQTRSQGSSSEQDCFSKLVVLLYSIKWPPVFCIAVDPLLLECSAEGSGSEVTITCQTNRPPASTLCSFDGGLTHSCGENFKLAKLGIELTFIPFL